MVIFNGVPSRNVPTSVSSTFPLKIRSFMSATVATVVPSFRVLAWMTELPTLTGMSRIKPEMVERMSVELDLALLEETPSRIISSASCAADFSSRACCNACVTCSNSSLLTNFLSYRAFSRS